MCGIAGFITPSGKERGFLADTAKAMSDAIPHRGPDDSDVWVDEKAGLALGHRRLSIIDLSPLGRQPMASPSGRYVICYNGEVYNFKELRRELEELGHAFRGGSDTEVLLAGFEQWGVRRAVERFVGMFAFALWDAHERSLYLVRDRLGIKPLYYGRLGKDFVFGSELKALRAHPNFDRSIDRDSLTLYFRHNYIPAPYSIYGGIRKLEPGQILKLDPQKPEPMVEQYWSALEAWARGEDEPFRGGEEQAIDQLEALLKDSIGLRMLADVPLGAFLSGGIDSSTVAALMQVQSSRPVKTFSIGFAEHGYNEAEHAKAVADHLGTEHTELYVTPQDLLDVVPLIPRYWDEPFADSSQIPTYLLSRLTREHVTVSLSGDGGDELFSGYDRYFWTDRIWRMVNRVPVPLRKLLAGVGKMLPGRAYDLLGSKGRKIRWRMDALGIDDFESLYRYFISHFKQPQEMVLGGAEPRTAGAGLAPLDDRWRWMSLHDTISYLPDDILAKVDRASMGVSLEARVPLLDHRVVEFAARVPSSMKVRDGQGKWLLRQVLYRHVPRELVERPKMGFGVPIERWMRNELREWCEDLLNPGTIKRQGYLNPGMVERMWKEYLGGESNWNYYLWDVLMFQAWLGEWEG